MRRPGVGSGLHPPHGALHRGLSSHFGELFRVSTFGESHGGGVGAVIDGCPARLPLTEVDIQVELDRRRPGQSALVTPRDEKDRCRILSGVVDGLTLGTPIAVLVPNEDARSEAYSEMETAFRPSHADYTYQAKYGIRAVAGGGRVGVFTLTRNDEASLEADLLVTYQVGGSAVGGVDYATLPGTR